MKSKVFAKLKKAYPFIYRRCNQYYYIGLSVFRQCTDEEKENYRIYREEFARVKSITYDLEKQDVDILRGLYNRIISQENLQYQESNVNCATEQLEQFIKSLSDSETADLDHQIKDFLTTLDYIDGAFYRERNDY